MKGDFSRSSDGLGADVTGVLLQQGRPILDVDWNRSAAVSTAALAQAIECVLGGAAAPARDGGFRVTVRPGLRLGASWLVLDDLDRLVHAGTAGHHHAHDFVVEIELTRPAGAAGTVMTGAGVRLAVDAGDALLLDGAGLEPVRIEAAMPAGSATVTLVRRKDALALSVDRTLLVERDLPRSDHGRDDRHCDRIVVAGPDAEGLPCTLHALRVWQLDPSGGDVRCVFNADLDAIDGRRVSDRGGDGIAAHIAGAMPAIDEGQPRLEPGVIYVGGRAVRNAEARVLDRALFEAPSGQPAHLVYLETVEQYVDALDDPTLHDPALGGTDTVILTRTRWHIAATHGRDEAAAWAAFARVTNRKPGRARLSADAPASNAVYRVEVHHPGWPLAWPLPASSASEACAVTVMDDGAIALPASAPALAPGAPLLLFVDDTHWVTRIAGCRTDGVVVLTDPPPPPLCSGTEVGMLPLASFKWSADNAARTYRVASIAPIDQPETIQEEDGGGSCFRVQLASTGFNGLDLRRGETIELTPFGAEPGAPGTLHRLLAIDRSVPQLDLAGSAQDAGETPLRARAWSAPPTTDTNLDAVVAGGESRLDADVSIQFADAGHFATGDAWTITVREGQDGIAIQAMRGPEGEPRRQVPLALVTSGKHASVRDLRRVFCDLPTLSVEPSGAAAPAPPAPPARDVHPLPSAHALAPHAYPHGLLLATPDTGAYPAGFKRIGGVVLDVEHPAWRRLPAGGPAGRGHTLSIDGGLLFLADGGAAWRWHEGGAWRRIPDQPCRRRGFAAVAIGAFAVVLGGEDEDRQALCKTIDLLGPDDRWAQIDSNAIHRTGAAAAPLGDAVLVCGGRDAAGEVLADVEVVELAHGRAHRRAAMTRARADHAIAPGAGGSIHVLGGIGANFLPIAACETFHPAIDRWTEAAELPHPVHGAAAAADAGGVLLAGGFVEGRLSDKAWWRSPRDRHWTEWPRLGMRSAWGGLAFDPSDHDGARFVWIGGEREDGASDWTGELALSRRLDVLTRSDGK